MLRRSRNDQQLVITQLLASESQNGLTRREQHRHLEANIDDLRPLAVPLKHLVLLAVLRVGLVGLRVADQELLVELDLLVLDDDDTLQNVDGVVLELLLVDGAGDILFRVLEVSVFRPAVLACRLKLPEQSIVIVRLAVHVQVLRTVAARPVICLCFIDFFARIHRFLEDLRVNRF